MKKRKVKTTLYGEVKVYDSVDEDGERITIIEGEPFKQLEFDDTFPDSSQVSVEDIEFMIDQSQV